MDKLYQLISTLQEKTVLVFSQTETYIQVATILAIYGVAYVFAKQIRHYFSVINAKIPSDDHPIQRFFSKLGNLVFPLVAIMLLKVAAEFIHGALDHDWILQSAVIVAVLLLFNSVIDDFVDNTFVARFVKWVGMPIIFLHMIGTLENIIRILQSMSITIGNIDLSAYGLVRFAIFGTLLFWLGRVSNSTGKDIIRRQERLDFRTKEVASKLLEIVIFVVVSLLLLQVMGINLTALAVFGGALGVGLGFGLQAIASNFISGIIILFDRSVSIDDFIELEDGLKGFVRELNLRSTTLETYDGKDIIVPNEKFIVERFTNWTHKNSSQRYQVEFSVAYHTDIRQLVELIKEVVASHPQVFSGDDYPLEEQPDCEISGFGDSGINMLVEFWMEGVDDGKNRVGGDLMLMILEALQENGYEIPFPQREVRVLNPNQTIS
jgi:small-conductance mechanosensitive channel